MWFNINNLSYIKVIITVNSQTSNKCKIKWNQNLKSRNAIHWQRSSCMFIPNWIFYYIWSILHVIYHGLYTGTVTHSNTMIVVPLWLCYNNIFWAWWGSSRQVLWDSTTTLAILLAKEFYFSTLIIIRTRI